MKSPLRIRRLGDDPNDAALIRSTLETAGPACVTTGGQNRDDFVAVLEREILVHTTLNDTAWSSGFENQDISNRKIHSLPS